MVYNGHQESGDDPPPDRFVQSIVNHEKQNEINVTSDLEPMKTFKPEGYRCSWMQGWRAGSTLPSL